MHIIVNLLGYMCAKTYQNWARFDKVIRNIIWCIFLPHMVLVVLWFCRSAKLLGASRTLGAPGLCPAQLIGCDASCSASLLSGCGADDADNGKIWADNWPSPASTPADASHSLCVCVSRIQMWTRLSRTPTNGQPDTQTTVDGQKCVITSRHLAYVMRLRCHGNKKTKSLRQFLTKNYMYGPNVYFLGLEFRVVSSEISGNFWKFIRMFSPTAQVK